ncbi:hypothetical protein FEM48_Zijuj04G0165100 [Ziziphus jujuba var. spinosa]|uniref:BED-type domain-containing protein n=1 Tax=Ziziphus jujuba var. spinosa TaxID=714518 RepID=A0A978VKY4_ZIZJJ|nr:hypothetical protein FEM48_Zijuj04G0165100 [Ziziphus jujuba var. spinosa]
MDMSDAVIVKSTRLKSVVWNDFDRIKKGDTCVAVCRHCKKKLSGSSTSGTSHLRNHLIRCQRRSSHGIPQLYAAREKKKEGTLSLTNFNLDQEQKKDEVLNLVNIRFEQDQMKEENINYVNTNFDQRRSRFDLARMIILHGYPLAMVEHVGFKVFVKNLQPLFELVTSERVEADYRLSQNRFLYCEGQLFDVRCAVSVLVVLAQDVLAALSEVVHKVRESIRYVKSSQSVQSKFSDIAQELGIQSQKSLCLDNPLRWDSTYVMLETALEYREAFSALQESDPLYSMCPSDVEWDRTNIINGYLKLFVEVTNVFTRNKLATANVYFPEICDVYLQLNECAPNRIDDVFESVKALYNEHSICLASLDQGLAWQVGGSAGCLPSSGRDSRDRLMGFDKFLHETSQSEGSKWVQTRLAQREKLSKFFFLGLRMV